MAERIYAVGEDGLEPLTEEPFSSEDLLQKLIAKHPEVLAGEQIRPDEPRRWIVTREKGIAETPEAGERWSVDHLLIDQDAVPTLVEVKRGSSSEIRRTIVGQLLEYAAHAARTWTVDDLRMSFEETAAREERDPGEVLGELLQSGGEPDADEFWRDVATNLAAKRLRLLFVADRIPDELARVVEFLNSAMPDVEVLAVEIKQFPGERGQTLVPRVIGRIAAAPRRGSPARSNTNRTVWEEQFPTAEARNAGTKLLDTAIDTGAVLEWGSHGVSVRVRCSIWPQPVTVAWLYPTADQGWMRTRSFSFGDSFFEYEGVPDELRLLLSGWADEFEGDPFTTDVSSKGVRAYAVDHAAAVGNIDLLTERLRSILAKISAL
ncbi:MAG: hypothetical protein F4Y94_09845 [Chloroflexi bacterium]|nr:hypothetical protein [Chloroflexota bacterium]